VTSRTTRIEAAARLLLDSADRATLTGQLTESWPELDVATGYLIQDEILRLREERGERVVGAKLGLTSRAKQLQVGIDSPIAGWLTDTMVLPESVPLPAGLVHPRAEPEIAFVLGERLEGPGVTAAAALGAVSHVYAGAEILDSRYTDFRFTLPDVLADNASSAYFALGSVAAARDALDLSLEACLVEVDGVVVDSATGAAVLGHPAEALAHGVNALAERGRALESGWMVLTGGLTDAVGIASSTSLRFSFSNLGDIVLRGADAAR
jgi:2-oxo-3-hexenedioate decarboxylase